MNLLRDLGLGALCSWLLVPLLVRLCRTSDTPRASCTAGRTALIGSAALPVGVAFARALPEGARPSLPGVVHVEAWFVPTNPSSPPLLGKPITADAVFWFLGVAWCVFVAWGIAREVAGAIRRERLWAHATKAPSLERAVAALASRQGLCAPEIRVSSALRHAGTFGVIRPRIVCAAVDLELDDDDRARLIAHELCHVRRRDAVWQVLEGVAACALCVSPARRALSEVIATSREGAVDSEVGGPEPQAYAALLVNIAERGIAREPPLVSSADTSIERRIRMLLNPKENESRLFPTSLLIAAVLGAGALTASAAFADPARPLHFHGALGPLGTGGPPGMDPRAETDTDACYEKARAENPSLVIDTLAELEGKVDGTITHARIPSTSATFQSCLEAKALSWRLPTPPADHQPPPDARLMVRYRILRSPK